VVHFVGPCVKVGRFGYFGLPVERGNGGPSRTKLDYWRTGRQYESLLSS